MRVRVRVCVLARVSVYLCKWVRVSLRVRVRVRVCVCVRAYARARTCICARVYVCLLWFAPACLRACHCASVRACVRTRARVCAPVHVCVRERDFVCAFTVLGPFRESSPERARRAQPGPAGPGPFGGSQPGQHRAAGPKLFPAAPGAPMPRLGREARAPHHSRTSLFLLCICIYRYLQLQRKILPRPGSQLVNQTRLVQGSRGRWACMLLERE